MSHGERGSKVVFVVSEPITASTSDWVEVPRNSALVISRGKGGYVNIIQTPLASGGKHQRQAEVQLCAPPIPLWKIPRGQGCYILYILLALGCAPSKYFLKVQSFPGTSED